MHYVWKHRMMPACGLKTTCGQEVEVIDTGLPNTNAGPDFFNAKVKIGGTLWAGNVEIHTQSADWYRHRHDRDAAYNNVVLHITGCADCEVLNAVGRRVPQMVLQVPESVAEGYGELMRTETYPPCYRAIQAISRLTATSWLAALQAERLEQKARAIELRAERAGGSWEDACFMTLARNYGFGINGDTFERWASAVPLGAVAHHRDDLFQIEAIFMGQAGLLADDAVPERYRDAACAEGYFGRLQAEYRYLAHKFSLTPIDHKQWRFLRLRPQNFPHIRISQLANLYYERKAALGMLLDCKTTEQLAAALQTRVTPYWETHYTFGATTMVKTPGEMHPNGKEKCPNGKQNHPNGKEKSMSPFSINLLIINTAIPMLFAYGRHIQDESLCRRATDMLETLKPENNHIVRMWRECGLQARNAGESQALIQLKNEYCNKRDCLRCRFGYEYLKGKRQSDKL